MSNSHKFLHKKSKILQQLSPRHFLLVENKKMPEEDEANLESLSITKLKELAKEKGIKNYSKMNKAELLRELDK